MEPSASSLLPFTGLEEVGVDCNERHALKCTFKWNFSKTLLLRDQQALNVISDISKCISNMNDSHK